MDIHVTINYSQSTPLCSIMRKYGSDKGYPNLDGNHNYTLYYYPLLNPVKDNIKRVFELGLGTNNTDVPSNMGPNGKPGASLRGWRDFFPNANVFGADIDRRVLFSEDRIQTFYCDQTDPNSIKALWNIPELQENFDLIIEDGLHKFHANVCFFENSIHKLNPGGVFIIEDLHQDEMPMFEQKLLEWETNYPGHTFKLNKLKYGNEIDNTIIVVQKSV